MKYFSLICIAVTVFFQSQDFQSFVNPFIGTGGHGHSYPGATAPFGMVQLSPDTRIDGSWDGCGGYHYSDDFIFGFSHTHLNGTGVSDYGDFMFMPTFDLKKYKPETYGSPFSHSNEDAKAAYYSVYLDKYQTKVELTATPYSGFHRYTFDRSGKMNLVLDLNHRDKLLEGIIQPIDDRHFLIKRRSEAWAKDQYMFAYIEFESPVEFQWIRKGNNILNIPKRLATFSKKVKKGEVFNFKVSLSFTGFEGAQKNSKAFASKDFNEALKYSQNEWNKELSKIDIHSDSKEKNTIFYTALYHTMVQPNIAQDIDGRYRGRDNQLHYTQGFDYYTVFSLWDTFRAAHPLYTLIDQKRTVDYINTFLKEYEEGGRLPVWEFASNETDCMIGYHSVSVIADAMSKGLTGFDYEKALEASLHSANLNWLGLRAYKKNHFIAIDDEHESVSKTLEYAYDDWCIAQMANMLGKEDVYKNFMLRSQSWKNVFDPRVGFMRARLNGGWYSPFDPKEVNNHFTEGNSWQYSFFVPQDIDGMIKAYGGAQALETKLDELFASSNKTTGRTQADITGLIGQYAHGNEPSHHIAYLYNYVRKPEKTKEKVHYILEEFYTTKPDGLIGNEDCGQMSAWYVLSSLGMYSIIPGNGDYWAVTEPIFPNAEIHLENGTTLKVKEIQSNKKPNIPAISLFQNVVSNEKKNSYKLISSPVIEGKSIVFDDSTTLTLSALESGQEIFFSTNHENFKKYEAPFSISESTVIYSFAKEGNAISDTIQAHYYKKPNNYSVAIKNPYNSQYSGGGDDALVNGLNGTTNWRKGDWQGYQGVDFEVIVDLKKAKTIHYLNSHYLQDTRAWIVMPNKVTYYISMDGINFKKVGETQNVVEAEDYEVQMQDFPLEFAPSEAHYVKVVATNFGTLPEWHQGKGGEAFIFVDEVSIE